MSAFEEQELLQKAAESAGRLTGRLRQDEAELSEAGMTDACRLAAAAAGAAAEVEAELRRAEPRVR